MVYSHHTAKTQKDKDTLEQLVATITSQQNKQLQEIPASTSTSPASPAPPNGTVPQIQSIMDAVAQLRAQFHLIADSDQTEHSTEPHDQPN